MPVLLIMMEKNDEQVSDLHGDCHIAWHNYDDYSVGYTWIQW